MKFFLIVAVEALTVVRKKTSSDGVFCCYNNNNSTCQGMIKKTRNLIRFSRGPVFSSAAGNKFFIIISSVTNHPIGASCGKEVCKAGHDACLTEKVHINLSQKGLFMFKV